MAAGSFAGGGAGTLVAIGIEGAGGAAAVWDAWGMDFRAAKPGERDRREVIWTHSGETLLSRPIEVFQTRRPAERNAVPHALIPPCQPQHAGASKLPAWRQLHALRAGLCLTTVAIAALLLLGVAGCQTPPQTAAPAYGNTVAPPGTGMINQPAPYGGFVSAPQGAAYPPAAPVMPGPSTGWQPGTAPAAAPNNSWSWSQTGTPATAPSMQQYGNQLAAQSNQYQQNMSNQAQQYANQMQAQPQQWSNSTQQALANQQQQLTNQMQNTTNQYQQQMQQALQAQQQQLSGQMQQAMPQQQTVNGNWWPFQSPSSVPPARSTPAVTTRY